MNEQKLQKILKKHKLWLVDEKDGERADLHGADLCGANLCGTDLRGADLRGADLDFSCWPFWCGSFDVKVDKKIAVQLAYHLCAIDCDDAEYIQLRNNLLDFANQIHRSDVPVLITR